LRVPSVLPLVTWLGLVSKGVASKRLARGF